MDPGLRRDDDHASACAQFDYTFCRGGDELEEGFSAVKPIERMSLEEFLRWDEDTDTRYEQIDSFPLAIPPSIEPQPMLGPIPTRINITLSVRQSRRLNPA
jgi:hypothetical protein